jgi:hypothetical protein
MDAVRDDGFTSAVPITFEDEDDFFAAVEAWAQNLRLDRQRGQPPRLALWCEASGMVPQLQRIAEPFGVGVYSSGGFDSLTDKHRIGREWGGDPVTVLHLGDHDPSGVHCFSALDEDVVAFAQHYGGDVEFIRLAVTSEKAALYSLPSTPPKPTDRRRLEGSETWQAEAIERMLDHAAFEKVLQDELEARQDVLSPLVPGRAR